MLHLLAYLCTCVKTCLYTSVLKHSVLYYKLSSMVNPFQELFINTEVDYNLITKGFIVVNIMKECFHVINLLS